jgi:hypothetical protein
MPGLWVPDASGQFVKAKGLSVADITGRFQSAKNAWVADAAGQFQKCWPTGVSIGSFTVAKGVPSWQQIKVDWSGIAASKFELRLAGASTILYSGTGTSFTTNGVPGTKYSYTLRAYSAEGGYVDSPAVSVTLDALPAPANFRRTGGSSTYSDFAWNSVLGATSYELRDTLTAGQPTKWSGSGTSARESGLRASTTYERAVKSKLVAVLSGLSNKVRYTTPASSSSPPGSYTFGATRAVAWAPGRNNWRPDSDGIIHGNGDNWSSFNNGNQGTFFFYNVAAMQALFGRVTRCKIELHRDSAAGYSAPQTNHFVVHSFGSRPAGSPMGGLGASADSGSMAWGGSGVFDLPVAWGQALIDGLFGASGIAWGLVGGRYMRGPSLAGQGGQGKLTITIG